MTRFGHKLNYVINTFVKHTPDLFLWKTYFNHYKLGRAKRIWYLSPMRAAKVQASLRIRAVSPEPSLLAYTSSESRGTFRQKASSLAPLNGWACAVEICHDGMLEDTNSLDGAQLRTAKHCRHRITETVIIVKLQQSTVSKATRGQFHKTANQELRLKFFLERKVYSYSVLQNLKLKCKIFHETGSSSFFPKSGKSDKEVLNWVYPSVVKIIVINRVMRKKKMMQLI